MLATIQEKFDRLTQKRKSLLQHLDSLSPETLAFKAGPDKWSVIEVIEHLVIVEDDFLKQATPKRPAPAYDPASRSPEKYQTVLKIMKGDIAVDVPHESMEPQGCLGLNELRDQWDAIRDKLRGFLSEINPGNQDDMIYRHPYAGPLDITQTLDFIDVHCDNHVRQIDKILEQAQK